MHFYETKIECPKDGVVQLTEWLRQCVRESGVQSGIAVLSAPGQAHPHAHRLRPPI